MLHTLHDLENFSIHATDGTLGHVKDFYFDDKRWVVRYLVVETGSWLSSRKVLLSPIAIKNIDREAKTLHVSISMEQVKNCPDIDTEKPVSRQYEIDFLSYYGFPFYWGNTGLWGPYPSPFLLVPDHPTAQQIGLDKANKETAQHYDHHLRSYEEVTGYHLHAIDGDIGHIKDMLLDEETWAIRYCIADTSNWWSGHQVLIAPEWIEEVNWVDSKVYVNLTQQQVQDAPLFDPEVPFNREHEKGIHLHYGRKGYWED
ncbi:MAG: PRC-barrel domain-containing protein [Pseudomonadota bacterium]